MLAEQVHISALLEELDQFHLCSFHTAVLSDSRKSLSHVHVGKDTCTQVGKHTQRVLEFENQQFLVVFMRCGGSEKRRNHDHILHMGWVLYVLVHSYGYVI